jgi:hypothetical protein
MEENAGVTTTNTNNPFVKRIGWVWVLSGSLVLASFFMGQFQILSQSINGIDLIRALNKDSKEMMQFLGEFTTFMMYFSILFAMFLGVWVLIKGVGVLIHGKMGKLRPTFILCLVSVLLHFMTIMLLENGRGSGIMVLVRAKMNLEPAFGYYLALLEALGVAGSVLAYWYLQKRKSDELPS